MNREKALQQLQETKLWDVIIIGGGATGLGAAIDAASRGYKTLLVEQADFAKGTSSRATKLVHGGVRYMAQGNIKLVRSALQERALLLQNAAHVCKVQDFIIPCYTFWQKIKYGIGLKLYDLLAGKYNLGKTKIVNASTAKSILHQTNNTTIKGGVVYKDGQFDDARLAIHLAQTANTYNATLLNYTKVIDLLKQDNVVNGIVVNDVLNDNTYNAIGKVVINATGVFVDSIIKLDNKLHTGLITPSQGIHLVINKKYFAATAALMIPKTKDGRVLFAVPWHNVVILGTTDTPIKNILEEPIALQQEIDFILEHFNSYTNASINAEDVQSVFVGLRPLVKKQTTKNTKSLNRDHTIYVAASNLINITGGKWTTYRKMAEDVINKAIEIGQLPKQKCITKMIKIYGNTNMPSSEFGSDDAIIKNLQKENANWDAKIIQDYHYTLAHIIFAVRYEMAQTVEDILARRTRLLILNAKKAINVAPLVAQLMATEMGNNKSWEENQVKEFTSIAQKYLLS